MRSIYIKEVASYFNSLIGYLAIAFFLLITGLVVWVFPDTSILSSGYASLSGFFTIAPYLFMFLIPAISMRSIAGEKVDGTFDLLRSRPHTFFDIVLGKYLGIITIGLLAILPTLLYAASVYLLAFPSGNIDIGSIIASYLGLFFLMSSYGAISIFCSSISNNPIVAFLLAVFACFIAFYGFTAISDLPTLGNTTSFIRNLGIQEHYDNISRGVLTLSDFVYFLSLSALFILFTRGHLGRSFTPRKRTLTAYTIAIVVFFTLNSTALLPAAGRIDFTTDKRFTLTETSKDILANLQEDVSITVFLTGKMPSGFERLQTATTDLLTDLKSYAKGRLHFNVIDPLSGNQQEQQAFIQALQERGITPTNISVKTDAGFSQQLVFPSAVVATAEQEITVNLLQQKNAAKPEEALNNSIENLEYAFLSAIHNATQSTPNFIGFTEGHGEPSDLELQDAMQSLMPANQVGRVHLNEVTYASLQQLKVIFIVKPTTPFSEADKYKLDYFIRQGGRVIWAIDQIDASLDYLRKTGSQPVIGRTLNLDDQLFLYGARLNYNLLADLNCSQIPLSMGSVAGQSQIQLAPWYFYPILMPTSTNPILRNLDGIRTEFIGTVDTLETNGIKKEILLSSSPFARTITTPAPISLQMVEEAPDPVKFRTKPMPVAVLLTGKFPHLFENRPTPAGITETAPPLETKDTKMVVIADGDWLINQTNNKDQSPYPLGWDRYTEQQFANKSFMLNMVDYLLNDERFINLRNREVKLQLLDQAKVKAEKTTWQVINVVAPVLLLSIIALCQQLWRRKKYGQIKRVQQ
ncbi:gliding motility-associated ABC transporter substrate-binding protein GldG [Sphingobacterium psychroaquaticum]|uniref:ABC-2 type transport system permease protein n=1 Tax=Sphingobacterium psychroaquaticum TaxID=561061 RepID=A0A1X7KNI0_9SPHI|nr:gliding motility-associated ABC transporter substrate-binding protein GldG [Sphingobacterium psychroaquaticum]SMG42275.1 ABC-2 type transport system permease protein [Sphingobacterium psychroaquaticum]